MTSLSNIESSITYSFEIYPFADPLRTNTVMLFNDVTDAPSSEISGLIVNSYFIESFTFGNDIFNPIQSGTAKITQIQYSTIDFFSYVQEGDLFFIKENGNNIFAGYIESLQLDVSMNGTVITLNFANFLKQFSLTKVFGQIFQTLQPAQGITLGNLLDEITSNTLVGTAQASSNLFFFDVFQGEGESTVNPNIVLKESSVVYVTISSFMTILQVLNKVLYPYQRLIYQDATGSIAIAPLSLFDDLQWYFSQEEFNSSAIGIPYTHLNIKKNAAAIPNYEYATLFAIPTAQGLLGNNQSQLNSSFFCQYTPPTQYFTRLNQLYNSGLFIIADVIIEDIIADPNKIDITLNNISEVLQNSSSLSKSAAITIASINQTPASQLNITSQDKVDVSAILFNYAARAMAEHLVEETQISITSPRIKQKDSNGNLLPLPINRLVDLVLDSGILETSSLFCRGYSLNYSVDGGSLVTLNLTKPLVGGAYWVNGALQSV